MVQLAIDRDSVVPLYFQIRQNLLNEIQSGRFKAGDVLHSEQQLSAQLGVSRMTARQALKSLCKLGAAYSLRGKGTFVSGMKLEINFRHVQSFTEQMGALGFPVSSRILALEVALPAPEVAQALRIGRREEVVRLHRLRLADGAPMAVESSHLPHRLFPGLAKRFGQSDSLYEAMRKLYGIRIQVADETIEVGLASPEEARLLHIRKGNPLFLFTRVSYVAEGRPVEYVKSAYRADRYKIVNRLARPNL